MMPDGLSLPMLFPGVSLSKGEYISDTDKCDKGGIARLCGSRMFAFVECGCLWVGPDWS